MGYLIRATVFALVLSSPLYPALYMAWEYNAATDATGCHTDTECMAVDGYDVWFTDELPVSQ